MANDKYDVAILGGGNFGMGATVATRKADAGLAPGYEVNRKLRAG